MVARRDTGTPISETTKHLAAEPIETSNPPLPPSQVDSDIIGAYSPLRALYAPNLIDATTYCVSAAFALLDPQQRWYAVVGAGVYAGMRSLDCIY